MDVAFDKGARAVDAHIDRAPDLIGFGMLDAGSCAQLGDVFFAVS